MMILLIYVNMRRVRLKDMRHSFIKKLIVVSTVICCITALSVSAEAVDYDGTELGYCLAFIDFRGDDIFSPDILIDDNSMSTVAVSDDGREIRFKNGERRGNIAFGGTIDGLTVSNESAYTLTLRIKSVSGMAGVYLGGYDGDNFDFNKAYGIYGGFEDANNSRAMLMCGSAAKVGDIQHSAELLDVFPLIDENGFAQLALEMNGYSFSVYYKCVDGEYVKFDSCLIPDTHDSLKSGLILFAEDQGAKVDVKNAVLYKGCLADIEPSANPETGDKALPSLWLCFAGGTGMLIVAAIMMIKRKANAKG